LSLRRQCELLNIDRSRHYYVPKEESPLRLQLKREIDMIYTEHPDKGSRRIAKDLQGLGYDAGRDLVRVLMQEMGIEALYAKPNLSKRHSSHKIYPYLLRGVEIVRPNQVWSTDITYVPMRQGFMYLTAVIDWWSRCVLSWRVSNTLNGEFCREVVKEALKKGKPEIFNTDQGSQYTSPEFIEILLKVGISVSMDGRGRALDNVFIERLWRTVKYEDIYLKDYESGKDLHNGIREYFLYYNEERLHSSLGYKTPRSIYGG